MAKRLTLNQIYIGQLIVRGEHLDAQVYTIAKIIGFNIYVIWFEGERQCGQWTDYGDCYKPTLEQIEYSIQANGKLASGQDIQELDLV
jgi:hypothetical protein